MKTINIAINILFFKFFSLHCSYACVQEVVYIIAHNIERFKLKYMGMSRVRLGTGQWFPLALCRGSGTSIQSLWSVHEMCGRQKISKCFWQTYWKVKIQNVVGFFSFQFHSNSTILIISWFFLVYLTDYFPSRIYTSAQCSVIILCKI